MVEENRPGEMILHLLTADYPRVGWDRYSNLLRTQLQETGRIRLYFITLADLMAVVDDLGIDAETVFFRDGYAEVVND